MNENPTVPERWAFYFSNVFLCVRFTISQHKEITLKWQFLINAILLELKSHDSDTFKRCSGLLTPELVFFPALLFWRGIRDTEVVIRQKHFQRLFWSMVNASRKNIGWRRIGAPPVSGFGQERKAKENWKKKGCLLIKHAVERQRVKKGRRKEIVKQPVRAVLATCGVTILILSTCTHSMSSQINPQWKTNLSFSRRNSQFGIIRQQRLRFFLIRVGRLVPCTCPSKTCRLRGEAGLSRKGSIHLRYGSNMR